MTVLPHISFTGRTNFDIYFFYLKDGVSRVVPFKQDPTNSLWVVPNNMYCIILVNVSIFLFDKKYSYHFARATGKILYVKNNDRKLINIYVISL